jgi:hypothetical protein
MTANLKFKLPEDREEHQCALDGHKWKMTVSDVLDFIRNKLKHCDLKDNQFEILEEVEQEIIRSMADDNLSLW